MRTTLHCFHEGQNLSVDVQYNLQTGVTLTWPNSGATYPVSAVCRNSSGYR